MSVVVTTKDNKVLLSYPGILYSIYVVMVEETKDSNFRVSCRAQKTESDQIQRSKTPVIDMGARSSLFRRQSVVQS
jgi:hypothetical protein